MVAFSGLCRSFSRLVKGTATKHFRSYEKQWTTSVTMTDKKSQAVSDGELNMSARGCGGSSSSLPGIQAGEASQANSVLSWAVSFEKLLEDPAGVRYFTAFLRSEVSAENILFWQACEKFQKIPASRLGELKEEARSIYQTYLSDSAPYSVNIDDTAKTEEKDLEKPTTDMFSKAQAQIFMLMKMDSYRRFVRSALYQSCIVASVEGKVLPSVPSEPACKGSWEDMATRSPSFSDGNKNNMSSGDSEASPGGKSTREKGQKRGSWGAVELSYPHVTVSRKESQMSVKSAGSVELGSIYRQMENGRSSPRSPEQGGGGYMGVEGGYCCVYLPDGSASLAPTRPGTPITEMLAGLCEKRGFPLKDIIIYLHGKDKQPLALDQDCAVLRDQQVSLELRVTFKLEVVSTGKSVGMVVKSSKTLQEALSMVLQKHQLKPQDVLITMSGSDTPVNMSTSVFRLANKTLQLHKVKDQNNSSRLSGHSPSTQGCAAGPDGLELWSSSHGDGDKAQPKPSKNHDMEGLMEMVSRVQCSRVDDQRGPLTKEQLELPLFLHLASAQDQAQYQESDQVQDTKEGHPTTSSSNPDSSSIHTKRGSQDHTTSTSSSAGGPKDTTDSPGSERKDLTETTL